MARKPISMPLNVPHMSVNLFGNWSVFADVYTYLCIYVYIAQERNMLRFYYIWLQIYIYIYIYTYISYHIALHYIDITSYHDHVTLGLYLSNVYVLYTLVFRYSYSMSLWWFPRIGVPPNHPFIYRIFTASHPLLGTTILGNSHIILDHY